MRPAPEVLHGEVVSADFDGLPDGRITIVVALPAGTLVAHEQVLIVREALS